MSRALALRRHAMVVPGPVTSAMSVGCHEILRRHERGAPRHRLPHVLDEVGRIGEDLAPPRGPEHPRDPLDDQATLLLEAMPRRGAVGPDTLAARAGLDIRTALRKLSLLESLGLHHPPRRGLRARPGAEDPPPATGAAMTHDTSTPLPHPRPAAPPPGRPPRRAWPCHPTRAHRPAAPEPCHHPHAPSAPPPATAAIRHRGVVPAPAAPPTPLAAPGPSRRPVYGQAPARPPRRPMPPSLPAHSPAGHVLAAAGPAGETRQHGRDPRRPPDARPATTPRVGTPCAFPAPATRPSASAR